MNGIIAVTVRLIRAGQRVYGKKWHFFGFFAFAFLGNVAMLAWFDLLPNTAVSVSAAVESPNISLHVNKAETINTIELPAKIEISKLGLSAAIANPTTTNTEALDKELLAGAVRYPTSAKLGEGGNVVLFGHSSYLPIVSNQAYKTFNGIQKLVAGDIVTVYSVGTAYTYKVRNVAKESAAGDAGIDLAVVGRVLTLATCNSFGTKSDRFVVTADFVESHSIAS